MEEVKESIKNIPIEEQKDNGDRNDYDFETEQFETEDDTFNTEWQNDIRNLENIYISNAKSYLEWAKSEKKIKIVQEQISEVPIAQVHDISLQRNHIVDKNQQYLPNYRINIKSGNSICVIKNDKEDEVFFCRRGNQYNLNGGMRKYYDLIPQYFNENSELSGNQQKNKFLTLNDAQEKLESGQYKVHLYNLYKESGEHFQISYLKKFDIWLIATKRSTVATKSSTILVKQIKDIEKNYENKNTYSRTTQISNEWFKVLDKMKKEDIERLKDKVQNLTLIGDYCGNSKLWPIVQQKDTQIVFNSIVENNSSNTCLPVEEAFKIFNEFNLKTAKKLLKSLKINQVKNQKKIATGRVEDEGQGQVVFIVAEDKNNFEQKTLSCCKLKNIEYKIYKKLRELLMECIEKKKKAGLSQERFNWELERLSEYNQLSRPLEYYLQLSKASFAFLDKNFKDLSLDILNLQFMRFIQNIEKQCRLILITLPGQVSDQTIDRLTQSQNIDYIEAKWAEDQQIVDQHLHILDLPPKISQKFKNQNLHFAIIGFDQMGQDQSLNLLQNEIEQLKLSKYSAYMQIYMNCKDKKKMIESHSQKVQQLEKQLNSKCPSKFSIYPSTLTQDDLFNQLELTYSKMISYNNEEQPEEQTVQQNNGKNVKGEKKNNSSDKVKVTVIHPIAIPGSGKSYFCNFLGNIVKEEYPNCSYYSVSIDQIRSKIMKKLSLENPELTNLQLFSSSSTQVVPEYCFRIMKILKQISKESKQAIIYLDKLFWSELVEESATFLKETSPSNIDLKISAFIVKSSSELIFKKNTYYLSEQIMLNCLNRALIREHETFNETEVQTLKIILGYVQMQRNFKLQTLQSSKYVNLVSEIPLINEEMSQIDQSLVNQIGKCLDLIPPGGKAPNSKIYQDLIQSFHEANFKFQYPDQEVLKAASRNFINDCINLK